ncbi:MAG: leucyl/phenylalanyl-tRNA--protein transferase [Candidatus Aminicenantes bacterium]|nr:MAG: leucyl/phenylalanyl-tRNA--protein transferase [Candidatus Aminicenantes bacterium]
MPIYLLGRRPVFPPPELATPEGIVAAGGDLSPQRLLNAYASGIFPWFSEGDPILWWSPDPRMVLLPGDLHISRSMKKLLKKNPFYLTYDRYFREVIENCRKPRKTQPGTWITKEMRDAYVRLHELGFAHSVEVWDSRDKKLVGGIYGISLGKCFFGESMFHQVANASKYVFITLVRKLFKIGFLMLDGQVPSAHLKTLGCKEMPRKEFLALLNRCLAQETFVGKWEFLKDVEVA